MCFAEIYTMITGTCISPEDKIITDDRYLKQTLFRIHYFCKNTRWKLLRSIKLRLPLGQNFWCVLYTRSAFFQNFGGPKWGVRIIHYCVLYSPKYGKLKFVWYLMLNWNILYDTYPEFKYIVRYLRFIFLLIVVIHVGFQFLC